MSPRTVRRDTCEVSDAWPPEHELIKDNNNRHANVDEGSSQKLNATKDLLATKEC